jgi:ribosomal protein S18 acetylase RimI-like enzyme
MVSKQYIDTIRRFNRVVTERVGALNDAYLARDRPLGASRLLWEIGNGVGDVRALRAILDLDSGYMSRLLRSLETEGLVTVGPADHDRRLRVPRLTAKGRREHHLLNRKSNAVAESMLEQLDTGQRQQLVDAMATVERLLTAGMVDIASQDPASADSQFCIGRYFDELDHRFHDGFDPALSISVDVEELSEPAGLILIARLRGAAIGCGAIKFHDDEPAEIKRMWVSPDARGFGLGRRLLIELERHAAEQGVKTVRLETNRSLTEAIGLYRSAGYREVPAFSDERFAHHWFEKLLSE